MDSPAARLNPTFGVPHGLTAVSQAYEQSTGLFASRPVASGALAFQASAPIGSHAGSMVAGSSRAFWYSAGSMLFGTATS